MVELGCGVWVLTLRRAVAVSHVCVALCVCLFVCVCKVMAALLLMCDSLAC